MLYNYKRCIWHTDLTHFIHLGLPPYVVDRYYNVILTGKVNNCLTIKSVLLYISEILQPNKHVTMAAFVIFSLHVSCLSSPHFLSILSSGLRELDKSSLSVAHCCCKP